MKVTIPHQIRVVAYILFGALATAQTALYAFYSATHHSLPAWLVGFTAAYVAATSAPFTVAVLNISPDEAEQYEPKRAQIETPAEDGSIQDDDEQEVEDDAETSPEVVLSPTH